MKVGGFIKADSKMSDCNITFYKNEYYSGEKAQARVICDNSACERDVEFFGLKLVRTIHVYEQVVNTKGYSAIYKQTVAEIKSQGCKKHEKVDRMLEIQIPQFEFQFAVKSVHVPLDQDETKLNQRFTGSVNTSLLSISYTLSVTVKHDLWHGFGNGESTHCAVNIYDPPD